MPIDSTVAWLHWDPPLHAFTLPFLDRPIAWYGICFAFGFVLGFYVFIPMFRFTLTHTLGIPLSHARELSRSLADKLIIYIVIGTVVGARLGHVIFYDWSYYQHHLPDIFKVWEGGLASHGGTLGVLLGIFLFWKRHCRKLGLCFISLVDLVAVPTALTACWIRIGNFINQEILGVETSLPWGIVFGHPFGYSTGLTPLPRHPAQLYEAACYLATFVFLYVLWSKRGIPDKKGSLPLKPGVLTGLFFIMVFGSRFVIEFLKIPQQTANGEVFLQTGHYLSIPFIALGLWLTISSTNRKCSSPSIDRERTIRQELRKK